LVEGNPAYVRTLNSVGMTRREFKPEIIATIKKAYRSIYRSKQNLSQAIEEMKTKLDPSDELNHLIQFLEQETDKGIAKSVTKTEK
jgi:UDP-N-acetylglucosamine acyltransferase